MGDSELCGASCLRERRSELLHGDEVHSHVEPGKATRREVHPVDGQIRNARVRSKGAPQRIVRSIG
jgi:hypothetical protein